VLRADEFDYGVAIADGEEDPGVLIRFGTGLAVTVALDAPADDVHEDD
jgi:hypothetical protein